MEIQGEGTVVLRRGSASSTCEGALEVYKASAG